MVGEATTVRSTETAETINTPQTTEKKKETTKGKAKMAETKVTTSEKKAQEEKATN